MFQSAFKLVLSNFNGQVENADFLDIADIADFISPTFINPCFQYSPIVNIENTDVGKSRIFKHLSKPDI